MGRRASSEGSRARGTRGAGPSRATLWSPELRRGEMSNAAHAIEQCWKAFQGAPLSGRAQHTSAHHRALSESWAGVESPKSAAHAPDSTASRAATAGRQAVQTCCLKAPWLGHRDAAHHQDQRFTPSRCGTGARPARGHLVPTPLITLEPSLASRPCVMVNYNTRTARPEHSESSPRTRNHQRRTSNGS